MKQLPPVKERNNRNRIEKLRKYKTIQDIALIKEVSRQTIYKNLHRFNCVRINGGQTRIVWDMKAKRVFFPKTTVKKG